MGCSALGGHAGTGTSPSDGDAAAAGVVAGRVGAIHTSSAPAASVTAVISHPAVWTPWCLLTSPKARAMGRKAIQVKVLTPEATPARTVEGTASLSRREMWMPAATINSAS